MGEYVREQVAGTFEQTRHVLSLLLGLQPDDLDGILIIGLTSDEYQERNEGSWIFGGNVAAEYIPSYVYAAISSFLDCQEAQAIADSVPDDISGL